ncbi:hypothetical protein CC1G_15317 [Coprinopsis cinerea okayama7|uniref:Uncharacterized protein n=1 Tax=Coprinopsis cinerea (strain Okayama-7 / 130 / ATCC MYA-4618 / FGSC 9003) TaxID=240176 RepID=D6RPZ6_COPC7|nr:hypothetical protein CC1G_15317 [Coprinopsis cinerea okayama7\|eukprot:XP_002910410.1 hypothetical protein CC1G_15317 [Coprinopsis cinerea okayama7\
MSGVDGFRLHHGDCYDWYLHVGVKANVVDVKTGLEQTTNDFRFTWYQDKQGTQKPRMVVPKTYQGVLGVGWGWGKAMLWLEGKRALELGARIRGSRK